MKDSCLVLIAHGSKNPKWLEPFEKLARDLKQDVGEDKVFLCFMEHAAPSLPQLAQQLADSGMRRLRVLPLFMATGNHLQEDIPGEIEGILLQIPGLEIELLSPIGQHPMFLDLMRALARECVSSAPGVA